MKPQAKDLLKNHRCAACDSFLPSVSERLIGICECCVLPRSVVTSEALGKIIEGVPLSLACTECDIDSPSSLAEAAVGGWRRIVYDDGCWWNFLGICGECCGAELSVDSTGDAKAAETSVS